MSKISKSEDGKILVDGKSFDAGCRALSDDELGGIAGGGAFSSWDGGGYAICDKCFGDEFDIVGSFWEGVLHLRCRGCGKEYGMLMLS